MIIEIVLGAILNLSRIELDVKEPVIINTELFIDTDENVEVVNNTPKVIRKFKNKVKHFPTGNHWKGKDRSRKNYFGGRALNRMK